MLEVTLRNAVLITVHLCGKWRNETCYFHPIFSLAFTATHKIFHQKQYGKNQPENKTLNYNKINCDFL